SHPYSHPSSAANARSVVELFEAAAARHGESDAVVYEGKRLSYRELNARANQLARSLKRRGVGPEVVVGLLVERSVEMIVGMLGILKSGGAYVPLDPALPQERLSWMLQDSGARLVVTQEHLYHLP